MQIEGSKSLPSFFGHITEAMFDEYPIYKFNIPSTIIDKYLLDKLGAFSSTTMINLTKRHFFYSKPIIYASRCQLSKITEQLSSQISLSDLLKELLSKNNPTLRYNFVIMGNHLVIARIPHHRHVSYHLLCKHITLSNRSTDVRFAGELWCDENDCFYLNNNSGTYRPSNKLIEQTALLFNELTPLLQFKGVDFRTNIRPSTTHRFSMTLKKKININHT